ncbi:MAG: T9SS type A sorting domain-containing protein [Putridiphycobacter sp.]
MKLRYVLTGMIASLLFSAKSQVTVPLSPTQDNSMYSENTSNSNGLGKLYAGTTCTGNFRRALIQYDFSVIPAGSIITNVSLTLNVDQVSVGAPATSDFTLHKVTTAWGEGTSNGGGTGAAAVAPDATWSDAMFGTSTWTTAGGDYNGTASASTTLTNATGNFTWSSSGMIADVQSWVNMSSPNNGWILIGDEATNCTAKRFGSNDLGTGPNLIVEYMCPVAPTAVCKDDTIYLDQSGLAVVTPSLIDGGSFSNCNSPLSFNILNPTVTCSEVVNPNDLNSLIISAAYDGPLTGGVPKGVELYVINDIPDLSVYGIGSANNGGGSDGEEFTFPPVSASAGDYIYVASESTEFTNFFGFAPDYTTSSMGINGDDAVELFKNGSVIDVFGDINVDGTGQTWEYLDGWAARNDLSTPNMGAFVDANWTYSGPNALDGESANSTAASPVPVGVFTTPVMSGVAMTFYVTDTGNNLTDSCTATVTVLDTIAPTANCIGGTPTFALDNTGNFMLQPSDLNNGSTDNCSIDSLAVSKYYFDCSDIGLNTVSLYVMDASGNSSTCMMDIMIDGSAAITIDSVSVTDPTCYGQCDGELVVYSANASTFSIDNGASFQADSIFTGLCAGSFDIVVENAGGCSATTTATLAEPDSILINGSVTDAGCSGEPTGSINVNTTGGTPAYTFAWQSGQTTESISNVVAGNYTLTVTDADGCTASQSYTVNSTTTIDNTVSVNGITLTSNENGPGVVYEWVTCPDLSAISGENGQSFTPTQNGSYAVMLTAGSCLDTSDCIQITNIGLNENGPLTAVEVYPNPTSGQINISLPVGNESVNIIVMDLNGKVVKQMTTKNETTTLNLEALENGIYFISVNTNEGTITKKVSLVK